MPIPKTERVWCPICALDSTVTSYFNAADAIENVVDQFDERSLSDDGRRELLTDLVAARLRRWL